MKAERRGFIFARVGVRIAGHHRFLRIPAPKRAAALGVWLAALTFTREEQLDGFCPVEAIQPIAPKDIVDRLVEVGLFTREDQDGIHCVRVLKYEEFNDTKAEIADAQVRERHRKSDWRNKTRPAGVPPDVPRDTGGTVTGHPANHAGSPFSSSSSSSVSSSFSGSPGLRINPPAQSFQDSKGEPSSGVLRAADVLRTGENENRRPRKDPDIVAKAVSETERLNRAMGGKP